MPASSTRRGGETDAAAAGPNPISTSCASTGATAVAVEAASGEPAQLERGGDAPGALERAFEQGQQHPWSAALAAQPLGEPHRAGAVGERGERRPGDGEGAGDAAQRPAARRPREHAVEVDEGVQHPEREDAQGDGEGAGCGIPQTVHRDRTEQHDVRERRRQPHRRKVQQNDAVAVGAVEEDAVRDPGHHEPCGEDRRGTQGTGSEGHVRMSARPVRRSG